MAQPKTIAEKLAKLEASIDAVTNSLEIAGFYQQMRVLDEAAERIENLREEFEAVL
jgi:hypothetical protein